MNGIKVCIPKDTYDKIMFWVNHAKFEVSGFGTVVYEPKEKTFTITDAFLLKQEGAGAHTDIDATSLSKLQYHIFKNKIPGELRFWWHSHVQMPTFWSGTDLDTIKDLGKNGWIVATVFNQKSEMKSAFCAKNNVELIGDSFHLDDDVDTEIPDYYDADLMAAWTKEFDDNVTERTYRAMTYGYDETDWQTKKEEFRAGQTLLTGAHEQFSREGWPDSYHGVPATEIKLSDYTNEDELKREAKLLKMSVKRWREILDSDDDELVDLYQLRLADAMDAESRTT